MVSFKKRFLTEIRLCNLLHFIDGRSLITFCSTITFSNVIVTHMTLARIIDSDNNAFITYHTL